MLGGERVVEIELDRNTDFEDKSNVPRNQLTPTHTPSSETNTTPAPIVNGKRVLVIFQVIQKLKMCYFI